MLEKFENSKIAVLVGGRSREREISLKSGEAILSSLNRQGYHTVTIDAAHNLAAQILEHKPDAVIIALHGCYGEDGTVQGLLEVMKIPYSGSGVLPSAICMDKALTNQLLANINIPIADNRIVSDEKDIVSICRETPFPYPLIVKPNREGSTIGVYIVKEEKQLENAIRESLEFDRKVLVERFIKGVEVTVGLINGSALPVLEVVPHKGFYDFESKYTKGMTEYIVPARIPEQTAKLLQKQSEIIFNYLNLDGVVRIDFIIEKGDGPIFLEVNTIPGMTETSLVPKAAQYAGIDFDRVVESILESVSLKQ